MGAFTDFSVEGMGALLLGCAFSHAVFAVTGVDGIFHAMGGAEAHAAHGGSEIAQAGFGAEHVHTQDVGVGIESVGGDHADHLHGDFKEVADPSMPDANIVEPDSEAEKMFGPPEPAVDFASGAQATSSYAPALAA